MESPLAARPLEPTRLPPQRGALPASKAAGRFRIDKGWPLHVIADTDLGVEVVLGRVWLTDAGDHRDHFPTGGSRMDFATGADLMIEADGGSALIRVIPARRSAAVTDGLGHRMGYAVPGKPLFDVANLLQRTTHGFVPVGQPAPPLPGANDGGSVGGAGPWGRLLRQLLGGWVGQRARLRVQRDLSTLDTRQLRDIGAPDWVLHAGESREREARMRTRMAGLL